MNEHEIAHFAGLADELEGLIAERDELQGRLNDLHRRIEGHHKELADYVRAEGAPIFYAGRIYQADDDDNWYVRIERVRILGGEGE